MSAPDRTAWLEWRRQGLGSSDVAAILGLSRWGSPWSVWAEKVGLTQPDEHDTAAMEFGRRAEPMVGPWFEDITGYYLAGEQTWAEHPADPWKRATVDAFVLATPDDGLANAFAVAEIKTTSSSPEAWADEVPTAYQAQCIWHAVVTGHRTIFLPTLHLAYGRPDLRVYELDVSAEEMEFVVERATAFWHKNVLAGDPPEPDGHPATTAAIAEAYALADEDAAPVDLGDMAGVINDYREAKRAAKEAKEWADVMGNQLRAALANRQVGQVQGSDAVTWKQSKTVDVEQLLAAHPAETAPFMRLDLAAFRKASKENDRLAERFKTAPGSRRLLLKKEA